MARRFVIWIMAALVSLAASSKVIDDVEQAMALAGRLAPALADKVVFEKIEDDHGKDVFTLDSRAGKVVIGGNNAGSMAVGLNCYLNRYCKVTVSWYADIPVCLPKVLPDVSSAERVSARVPQRFFLN